jgi:hypothetical protein
VRGGGHLVETPSLISGKARDSGLPRRREQVGIAPRGKERPTHSETRGLPSRSKEMD